MQTRTKKTLATTALGLAAVAAAAGSASAADLTGASLGSLPVSQATGLLPSGNRLSGNQVAPVSGLLGGLPAGGGVLGG